MPGAASLIVKPLRSASDRKAFRRLPFAIYRGDPAWVPPLNRDVRGFLNTRKHPFYEENEASFFLALRGGRPVGRIAAIHNRAHNRYYDDRAGFFGFYESEEDPAIARALLGAAVDWLEKRSLDSIRGPLSPSTNYTAGLLVEGDPGPPSLMMPYNPPWYADQLEACGLEKCMDLLAYDLNQDVISSDRWRRIANRVRSRTGCSLRPFDLSRFREEVHLMVTLYHHAWAENWGFVPMSPAEVRHMASELKPILEADLAAFAVIDGREVGFYLALRDFNQVMIDMGGRLLPFGIFRLLAARRRIDRVRLLLMGVRPEFKHMGLDVLFYERAFTVGLEVGVYSCEASWILETNAAMINAMERGGARIYRRYRVYEGSIG